MKTFSYILILIATFWIIESSAMGLGDWQNQTPGGNIMEDPGNGIAFRIDNTDKEIYPINEWYFYKNYLIGKTSKEFFVVNEDNGDIKLFKSNLDWTNFIKKNDLTPTIWTRWYSDNWVDYDIILVYLFFGSFIIIPLTLVILIIKFKTIKNNKFKINKNYLIGLLPGISVFLIVLLLDKFPSSI